MRTRSYGALPGSILLLLASAAPACAQVPTVTVHAAPGDVAVTVEVVDTPAARSLGLMYRQELTAGTGMLFVFDEAADHSFWMKNTAIPLDMIFIGEDRTIVGIVKDARPYTTTGRSVGRPSRFVLEVNAGFCDRHGIAAGDRVTFARVSGQGARAPAPGAGARVPGALNSRQTPGIAWRFPAAPAPIRPGTVPVRPAGARRASDGHARCGAV